MLKITNKTNLKTFGYFFSILFLILSIILNVDQVYKLTMIVISFIFFFVTLLKSLWLKELNHFWFKLGIFLSRFMSPLILAIIFYFIITPFGLIKKMFKLGTNNKMKYLKRSFWRNCNNKKTSYNNPF